MEEETGQAVLHIPEDRFGDPREEQEWFVRLPEHAKEQMRERWRVEEGRPAVFLARRRATAWSYVAEAAGIFLAVELFMGFSPLWAVVAGAAVGLVAWRVRAGTHTYAWLAFGGQALLSVLTGSFMISAFIARVSFCAVAGTMHQMQRSDGTEPS